jgi:hypothetical protein
MTKICQKFIFHHHEAHILAQFDITLLYTIFQFWKISSFSSKHKGVSLQFYRKTSICNKNWSEIQISSLWGLYSCSIRHYSVVHIFFEILKNIEFRFITQMGYPSILPKNVCSRWKHVENSYLIPVWPYSCSIRHYCVVHNFLEVLKNIEFQIKTQRYPSVLLTNVCPQWKRAKKSVFHPCQTHIMSRLHLLVFYINFRDF